LKKQFPTLEPTMPKLPKKEFIWSMESTVVSKRRQALEEYMVKIVQSMPTILRSDYLNTFFTIRERINAIKVLLNANQSISMQRPLTSGTNVGNTVVTNNQGEVIDNEANSSENNPRVRFQTGPPISGDPLSFLSDHPLHREDDSPMPSSGEEEAILVSIISSIISTTIIFNCYSYGSFFLVLESR
jgi:hypothetical protein